MTDFEERQRSILQSLRRARLTDWLTLAFIIGTITGAAVLFSLLQD